MEPIYNEHNPKLEEKVTEENWAPFNPKEKLTSLELEACRLYIRYSIPLDKLPYTEQMNDIAKAVLVTGRQEDEKRIWCMLRNLRKRNVSSEDPAFMHYCFPSLQTITKHNKKVEKDKNERTLFD